MIYFPNRESLIQDIAEHILDRDYANTSVLHGYVEKISDLARGLLTNAQQRAEDEKTLDAASDNG